MGAHHRPVVRAITGDWVYEAACRGIPVETFFSTEPEDVDRAKAVCEGCPVRDACLHFAVNREEWHGVWGGTDEQARRPSIRRVRAKRRGAA